MAKEQVKKRVVIGGKKVTVNVKPGEAKRVTVKKFVARFTVVSDNMIKWNQNKIGSFGRLGFANEVDGNRNYLNFTIFGLEKSDIGQELILVIEAYAKITKNRNKIVPALKGFKATPEQIKKLAPKNGGIPELVITTNPRPEDRVIEIAKGDEFPRVVLR